MSPRSRYTSLVFLILLFVRGTVEARNISPTVHQVTASAQGLSVNGYIVEGRHGLVVVDSALTVSDTKALRARVDALGKPLLAILLTHGHPDHYNGVSGLVKERPSPVPVFATAAVARVIRTDDAAKQRQWQPVFGAEWPSERTFPDHEVRDGQKMTFDGMTFVVHELGPSESHADSYWELLGPERAAFVGDQVLNGSHAYTNDGHTAAWLAHLERLSRELGAVKRIYPGHGPVGDASLFTWEKQYLTAYRTEVEALRAGARQLSEPQKKALIARMKSAYPTLTNDFMIALGADTVATELATAHENPTL